MIFDRNLMFCDEADVVGSGQIGDIVDLNSGDLDLEVGEQAFVGIVVTEDLAATGADITFTLETDSDDGFATENFDLFVSRAYLKAEIVVGTILKFPIPNGCLQFVRLTMVVTTPTTGIITAGFVG